MHRLSRTALVAAALVAGALSAHAQALGPQRQFLALEPFYEHAALDLGSTASKDQLNGVGGRLWVNLDPFHFILNSSLALSGSYGGFGSGNRTKYTTYGAEYNQFFVRRPLGGFIDPFLTLGGGAIRIKNVAANAFGAVNTHRTYGTLTPGGGIRLPFPNRFEIRGDVKDLIIFGTPTGTASAKRTTNNLLFQAGLGLTF